MPRDEPAAEYCEWKPTPELRLLIERVARASVREGLGGLRFLRHFPHLTSCRFTSSNRLPCAMDVTRPSTTPMNGSSHREHGAKRLMQITGESSEPGWGLFPAGWPGEVLRFIVEVWESFALAADVVLEPRITKLFTGAICDRYESEGRDWFVVPEFPDWDEKTGRKKLRTDIRFYPPGPKRRAVRFVFEFKRLNAPDLDAPTNTWVSLA